MSSLHQATMINKQVIQNAVEIRRAFQEARPFRHVQIDNFLEQEVCESLLRDFPSFDKTKAANEMGEVAGKAVIENVSSVSPFYSRFYQFINSQPFLDTMSDLTGIPDLLADETLFGGGTHENLDGQYLDAHIDFNIDQRRMLHRRMNLLIYLNEEWENSWGGSIELHSNPRNPDTDEVKSFLPLFNRAVIFETSEHSWHGFPVIQLPEDKKHLSRKSFSIYLYTKGHPAEEVVAPHATFYVARPFPSHVKPGEVLQESDYRYLRRLLANRDGLIQMYQGMLIRKEEQQAQQYLAEIEARKSQIVTQERHYTAEVEAYKSQLAAQEQHYTAEVEAYKSQLAAQEQQYGTGTREQREAIKELSHLLDATGYAAERLRNSWRWQLANPVAAIKAKLSGGKMAVGYSYIDKVVAAYAKWRASRGAVAATDHSPGDKFPSQQRPR